MLNLVESGNNPQEKSLRVSVGNMYIDNKNTCSTSEDPVTCTDGTQKSILLLMLTNQVIAHVLMTLMVAIPSQDKLFTKS